MTHLLISTLISYLQKTLTVDHFYLLACVEDQKLLKKEALRCSASFFDHSKARSTANPKLAFQAQTLDLRSFRPAYAMLRQAGSL